MKKYLLMLVALFSLSMVSCTEKAANTETTTDAEAPAETAEVVKPTPTGDAEKDAQACVDFLVKTIEETDFTNEESQKKLEETMSGMQKEFEAFYKEKGEDAYKAFDEAGKKASEKINLEELIMKKAMEAIKPAAEKAAAEAAAAAENK